MGLQRIGQLGHALAGGSNGGHHGWPPLRRAIVMASGQIKHGFQIGHRVAGAIAVGLVDHKDVRDLHQPGLIGLNGVAPPRVDHHHRGVRRVDDVGLHLSHPDGFHNDEIPSGGTQDGDGIVGGTGQAAKVTACGHGTDVETVSAGDVAHAHPVAQDGAARERARWVDGQDGDRPATGQQLRAQRCVQGGLAGAGRPGDAHCERPVRGPVSRLTILLSAVVACPGPAGANQGRACRATAFHHRQRSGQRPAVAGVGEVQQLFGVGGQRCHGGGPVRSFVQLRRTPLRA